MDEELKLLAERVKALYEKTKDRRGGTIKLRREARRMLAKLRTRYEQPNTDQALLPWEQWLSDNFYALESHAKQMISDLHGGGRQLPMLFELFKEIFGKGEFPLAEKTVEAVLREAGTKVEITERQFDFVCCALQYALLAGATSACEDEWDDAERERLISYAVVGLSRVYELDFDALSCHCSVVEQTLLRDPSGVYPRMAAQSRQHYRAIAARIAKKTGQRESEVAWDVLGCAEKAEGERERHVGYYLLRHDPRTVSAKRRGVAALTVSYVLPLVLCAAVWLATGNGFAAVLLYLPLVEIVRIFAYDAALRGVRAAHLPRLELGTDAPKTVIAVSMLLPDSERAEELRTRLEQLYFSNNADNLYFCVLADFKEDRRPENPRDEMNLNVARQLVERLNVQYGERFMLFVRRRSYSKTQGNYVGWERKRGAITEFIRFVKGGETSVICFAGNRSVLSDLRYLIALDSDTNLAFESANVLVSAAAHPLNRPVIGKHNRVIAGYGVIVPRMETELYAAKATDFTRIMAGVGGVSTYEQECCDFYQDLFDDAIFSGKGLLDIDAFHTVAERRFPENTVLSHDILEGAFLRVGLLSDVEMTDGIPSNLLSWFARLHRWMRGDWQNLRFLGGSYTLGGIKRKNPIGMLSRYKLLDNLRRSLVPAAALLCVMASCFTGVNTALLLCAAAFFSISLSPFLSALRALTDGGRFAVSQRFFTRTLPRVFELFGRGLLSVIMTAQQAAIALDAILRTLWRLCISQKNLLEWTTAAQSEQRGITFFGVLAHSWQGELAGLLLLIFAPITHLPTKLLGALFLLYAPIATVLSRSAPTQNLNLPDREQREFLLAQCARMFAFYETYANAENHWLPPDNVQFSPREAVARRTSPTNIGMFLLSLLAARDFHFLNSAELCARLTRTLDTVEALETYCGNLYNWYATDDLRVLPEHFVSAVDSGNYLCSLVTLKEGLREYAGQEPALREIITRLEAILAATDFSIFYSQQRKLLSIGIDQDGKPSRSYYDFLMSESRAAGYYAIATRQANCKHWRALGRAMSRSGAYSGPVSWTGTMFEYFMPHLFLPAYDGSLLSEALGYALYCQKKRARGVPWGISESGYFAFDSALNYQYKAHGIQKLGVKQGLDRECVVSPYSTFLTLPFDLNGGLKNLARLEKLGMCGRYGFYEAIDFTRARRDGEGAVVRSYMAHHVGMSIISCANALSDNVMQKRFMRDHAMRAAREFLQEKIAKDTVVYDRMKPEEQKKNPMPAIVREEQPVSLIRPQAALLEGAGLTQLFSDGGASFLRFAGEDVTRRSPDPLERGQGIFAVARLCGETICPTTLPFCQQGVEHRCVFSSQNVIYDAQKGAVRVSQTFSIERVLPISRCTLKLCNNSSSKAIAQVLFYLEPILAERGEYEAHPTFSKLFLLGERDAATDTFHFSRRRRDGSDGLHLTVGFDRHCDCAYSLRREEVTPYPEGLQNLLRMDALPLSGGGATPDGCCALRVAVIVPAHGEREISLLLSVAATAEESIGNLLTARERPPEAASSPLRSGTLTGQLGIRLLPALLWGAPLSEGAAAARAENSRGQDALWTLGISGDLPIVLYDFEKLPDEACLDAYARLWELLRLLRLEFDFCVLRTDMSAGRLPSGIHVFHPHELDAELLTALRAAACHIAGEKEPPLPPVYNPMRKSVITPAPIPQIADRFDVVGGAYAGERFYTERVTPLPFSHILANEKFGILLQDASLGNTWYKNAREGRLTPWRNDIARGDDGEKLLLAANGTFYDLIRGARASFSPADARYEGHCERIKVETRIHISRTESVKYLDVTLENEQDEEAEIICAYQLEPVLGVSRDTARYLRAEQREGALILYNPYMTELPFYAALRAAGEHPSYTTDRAAFLMGDWAAGTLRPGNDPIAGAIVRKKLPPRRRERIRFILSAAETAEEALALTTAPLSTGKAESPKITITTPDEPLNRFFNTFAAHQILAGRMQGRCAFYQCSGAYGFRDQLQDAGGFLLLDPTVARRQIERCCAVQFPEGDVLHWWHALPKATRGVRTTFGDDLLWLPFTVCDYVETTEDDSILAVKISYCAGEALAAGERERYLTVVPSDETDDVYGHCIRAIEHAFSLGDKGIPKIGCGDWNDGFSEVGVKGSGQSVWLGMFLALVFDRFSVLCVRRGEQERAQTYRENAALLRRHIDENCWDGQWYLRAFYDSGTSIGGHESTECQIDLLSQSFAVFCGMPDHARTKSALDSALLRLTDDRYRLVKLFDPPFYNATENPGYIMAYPRGVRENGGQYTHAAVWFAMALLRADRAEEGWRILDYLNPTARCTDAALTAAFKTEPYYMPADIYANEAAYAHGGWSIYTGAAAWYYRAVLETLLGASFRGGRLTVRPMIPASWSGFSVNISREGCAISLEAHRGETTALLVDGIPASFIPLDGKKHIAVLTIGS